MLKNFPLLVAILLLALPLSAQKNFPTPTISDVDLKDYELSAVIGQGTPTVVAVWATWCQPCHAELDHMKSYLDKWQSEYKANVLAISVDQRHMVNRIKPLVKRKGWAYDVLVDTQGKLQQALGFRSIPQMYIVDGKGKIVKSFTGYEPGREVQVDAVVRKLAAK
ncbi:MAG: TlpA disulfide reductase family protein [Bacteroidota bacterium]